MVLFLSNWLLDTCGGVCYRYYFYDCSLFESRGSFFPLGILWSERWTCSMRRSQSVLKLFFLFYLFSYGIEYILDRKKGGMSEEGGWSAAEMDLGVRLVRWGAHEPCWGGRWMRNDGNLQYNLKKDSIGVRSRNVPPPPQLLLYNFY